jgi:UDP-glucuronate decarboxylase
LSLFFLPVPPPDASSHRQPPSTNPKTKQTLVKTKPRVERNRVLVTGGAGFVGSHLCEFLVKRGDHVSWPTVGVARAAREKRTPKRQRTLASPPKKTQPKKQVICVDNFFTGSKDNIAHLLPRSNFELIRHDVVEKILLEVDQVYHLACPASPVHYKYNPIKTIKTSFLGTMNMLGLAKRTRARFLLASTSEVYGDPLEHPQTESYWGNVNPIGERSCYDEGKRAAECLTMDYHREHDLEVRIVRIFNTYGPRMALDDGRVVSNFVAQALQGEPITVYGDGQQTRSFQYVDDLIAGLVAVMDGDEIGPFNVGNPGEFTMLQLAELVQKTVANPKSEIVYRENTADDPTRRKPDITRMREKYGWEPKVELKDGIVRMLDDFKRRLHVE